MKKLEKKRGLTNKECSIDELILLEKESKFKIMRDKFKSSRLILDSYCKEKI